MELLVCCARTQLERETLVRIRALIGQGLDWAFLLRTSIWHGLAPLVYWHVSETCPEAIPADALEQLREQFQNNTIRNLFLTAELVKILDLFAAHGIRAIPYKGPILAVSLYRNLALRQFNDLDLLLHERDLPAAQELLIARGYRPVFDLTPAQQAAYIGSECQLPLVREDAKCFVELHSQIAPRNFCFALNLERLERSLRPVILAGREVPALSPENLLLALCIHGAKDLWIVLRWVCDIAELIRVYPRLDWKCVREQARTLGSERVLFLGLLLASELLGAELPLEMRQLVRADQAAVQLAAQVRRRLFAVHTELPGVWEYSVFLFRARERLRDAVCYWIRLAITPKVDDWDVLCLPRYLFPLYYALRCIRLLGKYGLGSLKDLLGFGARAA